MFAQHHRQCQSKYIHPRQRRQKGKQPLENRSPGRPVATQNRELKTHIGIRNATIMAQQKRYTVSLVLIFSLFFLWGFAHNLNPILIPHLKKACQLNDTESALIDSSFFIAYFVMA